MFQSTRPVKGATRPPNTHYLDRLGFNPRAP